jgi:hypothetical protein
MFRISKPLGCKLKRPDPTEEHLNRCPLAWGFSMWGQFCFLLLIRAQSQIL